MQRSRKRGMNNAFETQDKRHQKSETGVLMSSNFFKNCIGGFIIETC